MAKKKKTIVVTIGIVAVILALAGVGINTVSAQNRPVEVSRARGAGGAQSAVTVRVTPVLSDTIESSIKLNGEVFAVNQVSIFPTIAGQITETRFQVGDSVRQGSVVAMVDPSRPGQVFSPSPVVSTIGGTVLQVPVQRGDMVSTQTPVFIVGDLSTLMVETFVPERFSNSARRGLSAQITLPALPGEIFSATVAELSPVLDPTSRTLRVRLRFSGTMDSRIKQGMFSTVSLVTNSRDNVPIIPRGSAINSYDSWIAFTVDENNNAVRREVTLGLENENFIEVLSGLEVGDRVVSAGQNFLSDGDRVRIVE